jgi:hypothetical protein
MTGLKLFIMALFGRLRHQCCNCRKTFYRPKMHDWIDIGNGWHCDEVCPHCTSENYIVV